MKEIEYLIEGFINCWQVETKEPCDLRWQLKDLISRCFQQVGRDITDSDSKIGKNNFPIGMKTLSLQYTCLFKNVHRVQGNSLLELNQNLANHVCECHRFDSPPEEKNICSVEGCNLPIEGSPRFLRYCLEHLKQCLEGE